MIPKQLRDLLIKIDWKIVSRAQSAAFAANDERAALIDRINTLEKQIAGFEAWEAEKERYQLTEIAPQMFAYVIKPEAQGADPSHWICPACFQDGKKSILQGFESGTYGWQHTCPSCKLEINTGYSTVVSQPT